MIIVCVTLLVGCTTRNDQTINVSELSSSSAVSSIRRTQFVEDQLHADPIEAEARFWTNDRSKNGKKNSVLFAVPKSLFSESVRTQLPPNHFVHVWAEDSDELLPRDQSGFATVVLDPQHVAHEGDGGIHIMAKLVSVASVRTAINELQGSLEQMGFPPLSTGDTYKDFAVTAVSENEVVFSKPLRISAPFSPQLHGGYFVELSKQQASEMLPLPESLILSKDPYFYLGMGPHFYIENTIPELSYHPDPDVAERGTITGLFDNFTVHFYTTFITLGVEAVEIEQLEY